MILRPPLSGEILGGVMVTKLYAILGQLRFEIALFDLGTIREKRLRDLHKGALELSKEAERTKGLDKRLKIHLELSGPACMQLNN